MNKRRMKYQEIREKVIEYSLLSQERGLIQGTSGNISLRSDDKKVIAITPTSIPYEKLTPGDIPLVDEDGNILDGDTKPSSELLMHTMILKNRPDLNCVIHTHALFSTVISVINKDLPAITVPQLAFGMVPLRVAPFELPGSRELGAKAVEYLGKDGVAIILQNHGLIATAATIEKAFDIAQYAEEAAQVSYYALLADGLNPIPEKAVNKMREIASSGKAL